MSSILVVGATGATGKWVVRTILERGNNVTVVVRSEDKMRSLLPDELKDSPKLRVVQGSILQLSDDELDGATRGVSGVVSCLGHNMTFNGLFGRPRRLVTDAAKRIVESGRRTRAEGEADKLKFVLMNTTGVPGTEDVTLKASWGERAIIGVLTALLPPHKDNIKAAEYFTSKVGTNDPMVEWAVVRPCSLLNESDNVEKYRVETETTTSPIFGDGQTTRANVGHFMASLVTDDKLWNEWKHRTPVVYKKKESDAQIVE